MGSGQTGTASSRGRISLAWDRVCPFLVSCVMGCRLPVCFRMFVAVVELEKKWCSTCLHLEEKHRISFEYFGQ